MWGEGFEPVNEANDFSRSHAAFVCLKWWESERSVLWVMIQTGEKKRLVVLNVSTTEHLSSRSFSVPYGQSLMLLFKFCFSFKDEIRMMVWILVRVTVHNIFRPNFCVPSQYMQKCCLKILPTMTLTRLHMMDFLVSDCSQIDNWERAKVSSI